MGDVLSGLPADFPAALLVVQHRPADLPDLLDKILGQRTPLRVKEAEGVRKARIKAQVKCDQTDDRARPCEEKVAQSLFLKGRGDRS